MTAEVRPFLDTIERHAKRANFSAASISTAVALLQRTPGYETRAHDELCKAAERIKAAHDALIAAIEYYESRPVQEMQAAE